VVWGDGTGGSSPVRGSVTTLVNGVLGSGSLALTVYGRIPAGQLSTPASYADTILVTVTY
jgi:spore coat protein U-like protein